MIDPSSTLVRVAVVAASSLATLIVLSATSPSPAQQAPATTTTAATTAPAVPLVAGAYAAERLTFRYPQTWTLQPPKAGGDAPLLYLQQPGGVVCYWSVAARKVRPDETLEAMVEKVAHGMTTIYGDVKVRDKGITTAADGTRRGHVEYAYTTDEGGRAVHRQVLLPAGVGKIINVTEAASAAGWGRDGAALRAITHSIRLAQQPAK